MTLKMSIYYESCSACSLLQDDFDNKFCMTFVINLIIESTTKSLIS